MAAVLFLFKPLMLVTLAVAYSYYDFDRWTPEDIDSVMYDRDIDRLTNPVEDNTFNTDNQGIGMVSAVDVDSSGNLFVFHRADKPWTADTFEPMSNVLSKEAQVPISKDTVFKFNPTTGRLINSFGANFFNVPHGLKIDSKDNIWLTDAGRHQVFRFPKNATAPNLVLGEKFVPGNDDTHFCKPTDVAIASNGEFFVTDGYCNSRVLKYSKDGKLITKWGTATTNAGLTPFTLDTPHSTTLIEELDLVCVADRENNRALCYNAGLNGGTAGVFNRTLVPEGDVGKVFSIYYSKPEKLVIVAAQISHLPYSENGQEVYPARAFTYGLDGQQRDAWAYITSDTVQSGPSLIHSLCASKDGQDYFLADIVQQKVLKYTKRDPAIVGK